MDGPETKATAGDLTWDSLQKSIADMGRIPPPPRMRARPEFVSQLFALLQPAEPSPMGVLPMGSVVIKEVPDLPVRWWCHYDGKSTFQTLDGQTFEYEAPTFEDLVERWAR